MDTYPQSIPCTPAELKPPEPIRLNCKFHSGKCVLSNLNSESTFLDLLTSIGSAVGLDPLELAVFVGYPPRQINWTEASFNLKLKQIPIVSGDTLTVDTTAKRLPPSNPASATPDAPPTTVSAAKTDPHIVRLTAPSDNSCLFTSVLFCVDNVDAHQPMDIAVRTNPQAVAQSRELIASVVRNDPDQYSEAFLEMPNISYCHYIQNPGRWGGGIEVAILSQVFELEICVVDVQTGRIDRFGEDRNYQQRILLLYDGIHYDPLALADPGKSRLTSVFSTKDDQILRNAQVLAADARAIWQFTDTASFTLLCRQCQAPLTGQSQAEQHAKQTGHTEFSEITP